VEIGSNRVGLSGPAWEGVSLTEVALAVLDPSHDPYPMPDDWRHFHVFLPTAEALPYPILVNGAFVTDLSRQSLRISEDDHDYNAHLIRTAAALFADQLLPELLETGPHDVLDVLHRSPDVPDGPAAELF